MRISLFVALPYLTLAVAAAGCGGPSLPASYVLSAPGITVEVRTDPYGYTVKDGSGRAVLQTRGKGDGSGYGAVGYAMGHTSWSPMAIPGYYGFDAILDRWNDAPRAVSAVLTGTDRLVIELAIGSGPSAGPSAKTTITIIHRLRDGALRVEASAAGQTPRAWEAAFESPPGSGDNGSDGAEGFLGLGERFNRTNQRGHSIYAWPEEGGLGKGEKKLSDSGNPYPNGESMTYYPVPFFISTAGYGFWLDSTWRNQFDFAVDLKDAWRTWHIGPSLAYEVYVPLAVGAGDTRPWTAQILDSFTKVTGRPMVPPAWAFGPRRRIDRGGSVNGKPELQTMRDLDLALTAVDDATHFLPAGSDIGNETALADWVKSVRLLGARAVAYYNGYFKTDMTPLQADVDTAVRSGFFLLGSDGKPSKVLFISGSLLDVYSVDFSNADAVAWYQKSFQRAIALGYSGWMYDFGEYVQPSTLSKSGMTGEQFHNLFPVLYDKALHDALEASPIAGDWLVFGRSGGTGSSQYMPVTWSGDPTASFEDALGLPAMVRAGINMGLSGVPFWGSDISGFKCIPDGFGAADGELLTRWIQMGSMQADMHDENACFSTGTSGQKANIWTSMDAQLAWKTYARLHTRLIPYLQSIARVAHETGAPVMRHLFFEHPDDLRLVSVDDAFYVGPSLIAAPVVKRGAITKSLPLPAGLYLDWHDMKLVTGGVTVTLDAPLAKLPLLLRDGHLVPLLDPTIDTLDEGNHPGVIGPKEVAGVYDVVGLLSKTIGAARFTLSDGGTFSIKYKGAFTPDGLTLVPEAMLGTCTGCYALDDLGGGLSRVRISVADGQTLAGGLSLASQVGRRVRWELFLKE